METADKCSMCAKRPMELLPAKNPGFEFFACPNCDSPKGKAPPRKAEE